MSTNRIASRFSAGGETRIGRKPATRAARPQRPPAQFAPVPPELLNHLPPGQATWQEQLYRMAYEAAVASVLAARAERARWN